MRSDPVLEMRSDPNPVLEMSSDPVLKMRSDQDPVLEMRFDPDFGNVVGSGSGFRNEV